MNHSDTICAVSTPSGRGAIAVIRISGKETMACLEKCFRISSQEILPRKVYLKELYSGETLIDKVLLTYFASPQSFTGEDMAEISAHGSTYIQEQILVALLAIGCRLATAGEFTQRAFLNGKMDLLQAEAVADLIAADSRASHDLAINNLRGNFSLAIKDLREKLIYFAALLELELDFSEEDVEFANRLEMKRLMQQLETTISQLLNSFALGNAIKTGVPITIAGQPNTGKSTLLNVLLNENRAIVSPIAGTTRDTVEDTININGCNFRFIDTAGIRQAKDEIEKIGIKRTFEAIDRSLITLYVIDISVAKEENVLFQINQIKEKCDCKGKYIFVVGNKCDLLADNVLFSQQYAGCDFIPISAKNHQNTDVLIQKLTQIVSHSNVEGELLLTNTRHYQTLKLASVSLGNAQKALNEQLYTDLIAIDIREVLHYLSELIGEVSSTDILNQIFGRFCIGK